MIQISIAAAGLCLLSLHLAYTRSKNSYKINQIFFFAFQIYQEFCMSTDSIFYLQIKCWHISKISFKLSKLLDRNHTSSIKLKVFFQAAAMILSIFDFSSLFTFWVNLWHFMIFGVCWKMEWIKSNHCYYFSVNHQK